MTDDATMETWPDRVEWNAERDMLERLCAYALAIPAEEIPLGIIDPILGVRREPPE